MKKYIFFAMILLLGNLTMAQKGIQLTGQITDELGEALPGANVFILETEQGTSTNENGIYNYENLPAGTYTIEVTFVGYANETSMTKLMNGYSKAILHVQMREKIINLDNVAVVATRAGAKSPFTYSTISKEEIDKKNLGQDVPFLLRWLPSIVVTSDAGAGIGYTNMRIRGMDASNINVTINGIPLNDAESQQVFWVNLPDFISSTENVQIQRGVGTSTNGSGAFGASINLSTGKVHKESYGKVDLSGGSFNTRRASVQFGTGLLKNKFTLDGRLSKIESDGYIDRASVDLKSFFLSGGYIGEKSSLRFNVFSGAEVTYQAWNGVPYQWKDIDEIAGGRDRTFNSSGTERNELFGTPHDNEVDDYNQTHYQVLYNYEFSRNLNLNLAGHYTKGYGFFEQYKAFEPYGDYGLLLPNLTFSDSIPIENTDLIRRRWLDNDYFGGTWALNYFKSDNSLQLIFGGAVSQYNGDHFGEIIWAQNLPFSIPNDFRYYEGTGDKFDFNVYAKGNIALTRKLNGFLDLQFRRVDYESTGFDNDLNDVRAAANYNFFNPKIGLFYALNQKTKFYASFARTNREPNRGDIVDAPQDAFPEQETLNNLEAGYRQNWKKIAFGANLYFMAYDNQLVLTGQVNDVGSAIRVNVPDSYRAGIELVGGIQLSEHFRFDGTATFSQNKIKLFTEFVDEYDVDFNWLGQQAIEHSDTDISFSPNVIASGELTFDVYAGSLEKSQNQSLTASLLGKYVGEQYIDNTANDVAKLEGYFFSDFKLRYAFQPKLADEIAFTFLVQNVFNKLYENNAWVYRYIYPEEAGMLDPYTVLGSVSEQNSIGVFPQATTNFLVSMSVKF